MTKRDKEQVIIDMAESFGYTYNPDQPSGYKKIVGKKIARFSFDDGFGTVYLDFREDYSTSNGVSIMTHIDLPSVILKSFLMIETMF